MASWLQRGRLWEHQYEMEKGEESEQTYLRYLQHVDEENG